LADDVHPQQALLFRIPNWTFANLHLGGQHFADLGGRGLDLVLNVGAVHVCL
jgi:hypothetical protein